MPFSPFISCMLPLHSYSFNVLKDLSYLRGFVALRKTFQANSELQYPGSKQELE